MTFARTRRNQKRFMAGSIAVALASTLAAPGVFARISVNTIDPAATLSDNGRRITVTGPIACTDGEDADLRVIVTQRSTGAVAEGRGRITCTGETSELEWTVEARVQGKGTFEAGPATAVALAVTSEEGESSDAHQWLVDITLEVR